MPPYDELATFLRAQAREGVDIGHCLTLISEALLRAGKEPPANVDIRTKAKDLAKAAAIFAKALQVAGAIDASGDIARERPDSIWPFLSVAELIGPHGFDDAASALRFGLSSHQARSFDSEAGKAPALLFQVKRVEQQARLAARVFGQRGAPKKAVQARLGVELALVWEYLAGKKATYSGTATYDQPRGYFNRFAKLAIQTTDWDERKKREIFKMIAGVKKRRS